MLVEWEYNGCTVICTKREKNALNDLVHLMKYDFEAALKKADRWAKDSVSVESRLVLLEKIGLVKKETVAPKRTKKTPEDKLEARLERIARLHDQAVNAQNRAHSYGMGTKSKEKAWDRFMSLDENFRQEVSNLKSDLNEYWSSSEPERKDGK